MDNLALFLVGQGVLIGFSAAVLPGPLQGYLMSTALRAGWRRALWVVPSPLLIDLPVIIAVLFALEALAAFIPQIVDTIRVVGGVFVLWLAWGAWQDYRAGTVLWDASADEPAGEEQMTARGVLGRGMLLNALSPGPYLFWTTVNGPLLRQGLAASVGHGLGFLVAFYGTFLGLLALLAVAVGQARRAGPAWSRRLLLLVAVLLALFGAWLVVQGTAGLLGRMMSV